MRLSSHLSNCQPPPFSRKERKQASKKSKDPTRLRLIKIIVNTIPALGPSSGPPQGTPGRNNKTRGRLPRANTAISRHSQEENRPWLS